MQKQVTLMVLKGSATQGECSTKMVFQFSRDYQAVVKGERSVEHPAEFSNTPREK